MLLIRIFQYFADKQNKGAETDGVLIDDGCGNAGMNVPIWSNFSLKLKWKEMYLQSYIRPC